MKYFQKMIFLRAELVFIVDDEHFEMFSRKINDIVQRERGREADKMEDDDDDKI